jgi:3-isopropylmalate dehydrogenase
VARARGQQRTNGGPPRRPKLTLVDKANAIRAQDLWTRTFAEVGREFPDVDQNHLYVDACCMLMLKSPEAFDVIVTTNLFGDIITDLGAMLQGGLGTAASANLHPGRGGMFEPIHGSAPDIAGQGVASPIGAILSAGMLLDHLGEHRAAQRVEHAVAGLLASGRLPGADARSGLRTTEVGDLVLRELAALPV